MLDVIATSIYSALLKDLPNIEDRGKSRRPTLHDVEVYSFPQTWSSTALGFGGIGGQAFTTAQTVVVSDLQHACVYFGGQLAYTKAMTQELVADMQRHQMASVMNSGKYK
jgi:hypothetical protein